MKILPRLATLLLVTVICIFVMAGVSGFLRGLVFSLPNFPLEELFAGSFFNVVLLGKLYVLMGTAPLFLVFFALEFRSKPSRWIYLSIWVFLSLLSQASFLQLFSMAVAAILAGLVTGQLFWMLAGRRAGLWRQEPKGAAAEKITRVFGDFRHWRLVACALLALMTYQFSGPITYVGKMVWVSFISEPDLGVPPYKYLQKRNFTVFHKVALLKFPDAKSCLADGIEELSAENLKKMDWAKMENTAEAQICSFRLLGSYPGISYTTDWFLAQGMTVPDEMSSARPFKARNGNLRIYARWSIAGNGYKFAPPGKLLKWVTIIPPYAMTMDATWSPDGQRLIDFDISYLSL